MVSDTIRRGQTLKALGQKSFRTQSPHRGLRATQTARPWRMSRRLNSPRSLAGTIGLRASSTFTGSVCVVSPSRDRKSGVSGKRVAVRVDIGGRRSIKKKKDKKSKHDYN